MWFGCLPRKLEIGIDKIEYRWCPKICILYNALDIRI